MIGAPRGRRSRLRRDPLLRLARRRHRRRHSSARSSASTTARTSAARSRATSARSCSRPRAMEYYTAALGGSVDARGAPATARSRWCSTTRSVRRRSVMPNVLAKIGAEVLSVNPYASTRRREPPTTHDPRVKTHRQPRPLVGQRSRARVRRRRRDRDVHRRRGRPRSRPTGAAAARRARVREPPGARLALPVSVSREAERIAASARRRRSSGRSCRPRTSWRSRAQGASTSPRHRRAGSSGPSFLPAYDAVATLAASARPARRQRASAVGGPRRAPDVASSRTRPCPRRGNARAR